MTDTSHDPIFVLGLPRSGTTLLRMMLDSHPDIMCGPEAPWIAGRGRDRHPHLKAVVEFMVKNRWGAVAGFSGVDEDIVYAAVGQFIEDILNAAAREHGKTRWAEKTPENMVAVPFLARAFPQGRFIHLIRDGRDVALSTIRMDRRKIPLRSDLVRNTYGNALRRWMDWNQQCRDDLESAGVAFTRLMYEALVANPEVEMRRVFEFVNAPWRERVLRPHDQPHDVIDKAGEGMKSFFGRAGIDTRTVGRWVQELSGHRRRLTRRIADDALAEWGYARTP